MGYNPFDKSIFEKLSMKDLEQLRSKEISEGFFIEYKETFPESWNKLAKSIAAFTNTYGDVYLLVLKQMNITSKAIIYRFHFGIRGHIFESKARFPIWLDIMRILGEACGLSIKFSFDSIVPTINDKLYENTTM